MASSDQRVRRWNCRLLSLRSLWGHPRIVHLQVQAFLHWCLLKIQSSAWKKVLWRLVTYFSQRDMVTFPKIMLTLNFLCISERSWLLKPATPHPYKVHMIPGMQKIPDSFVPSNHRFLLKFDSYSGNSWKFSSLTCLLALWSPHPLDSLSR